MAQFSYIHGPWPTASQQRVWRVAAILDQKYPGHAFRVMVYRDLPYVQIVFAHNRKTIDDPSMMPDKKAPADPVTQYGLEESDAILMYIVNENARHSSR